ncbi:hypothetical protein MASR2M79_20480 [Aminivibrio sp.]
MALRRGIDCDQPGAHRREVEDPGGFKELEGGGQKGRYPQDRKVERNSCGTPPAEARLLPALTQGSSS